MIGKLLVITGSLLANTARLLAEIPSVGTDFPTLGIIYSHAGNHRFFALGAVRKHPSCVLQKPVKAV